MSAAPGHRARVAAGRAMAVAEEVIGRMQPWCDRIAIAGSLRRRSPTVGDVEIVYVPTIRSEPNPADMFGVVIANMADRAIAQMEADGVLDRRLNSAGAQSFGARNKLMRHRATLVPVDLFATTLENWANCMVLRTGPAELTHAIAAAAQRKGWKWNTYGSGFTRQVPLPGEDITTHPVRAERDAFDFVGIPYTEPHERKAPC